MATHELRAQLPTSEAQSYSLAHSEPSYISDEFDVFRREAQAGFASESESNMLLFWLAPLMKAKVLAGTLAVGGSAFGIAILGGQLHATADLNKAHTSSRATLIGWNPDYGVNAGTAYFEESLSAENIDYDITFKPLLIDLIPDPHVNKQLDGVGQEQFTVPFDAIEQTISGDKVDITVDASKITANVSWVGTGPTIRNYTRNKGGKVRNYDDQEGFRNNLIHTVGQIGRGFSINKLGNTYDYLDKEVNHDLNKKGLDEFGPGCFSSIQKLLETNVENAVKASAQHATNGNRAQSIGSFVFKGQWKFTPDAVPDVIKSKGLYTKANGFDLKNFAVDSEKCFISKEAADQQQAALAQQ